MKPLKRALTLLLSLKIPVPGRSETHFQSDYWGDGTTVDFTAGEKLLPETTDITCIQIAVEFPGHAVQNICLGTLIRRFTRIDRCEYLILTAAHCLSSQWKGKHEVARRTLAENVRIERLGALTSEESPLPGRSHLSFSHRSKRNCLQ